jgi:hypothetical protein
VVEVDVLAGAAQVLAEAHAGDPGLGRLDIEAVGEVGGGVPILQIRRDMAVDEAAQLGPPGVVLRRQEGAGRPQAVEVERWKHVVGHGSVLPVCALFGVAFELILKALAFADKDGILTQPTMFRAIAARSDRWASNRPAPRATRFRVRPRRNRSRTTLQPNEHPYMTGAWTPQHEEFTAEDMTVIGTIPTDIDGVYVRNTENPVHEPIGRYHPFDGDGMVHHAISFKDGKAAYRNRFVRTKGFMAEQEAGRALWAGLAEHPSHVGRAGLGRARRAEGFVLDRRRIHAGRSSRPSTSAAKAIVSIPIRSSSCRTDWVPARRHFGAPARSTSKTGELLFFNYSKPRLIHALRRRRAGQQAEALYARAAAGRAPAARHGVHDELFDPQRLPAVLGTRNCCPRASTSPASTPT